MRSLHKKPILKLLVAFLLLLVVIGGCADDPMTSTQVSAEGQEPSASNAVNEEDEDFGKGMPFADAEVFFEFNTTDNDLGLQVFLDAEGWRQVKISDPDKLDWHYEGGQLKHRLRGRPKRPHA
jgi:hypothetical protein